jgi:hypothetical protein
MSNNNGGSVKRTLREKKFIEAYIENCGNATEAYLSVSPDVKRDSAKELGKRMLAKLGLSIVEVLDKMGLSDPVISQKLIDGLNATRETGTGKDRKEKADHQAIVKYLDMILKLKASYPADRSKLELTGKDGLPLKPDTVYLIVTSYQNCPLEDTRKCPVKEEVELAEKARKESYGSGREQIKEK